MEAADREVRRLVDHFNEIPVEARNQTWASRQPLETSSTRLCAAEASSACRGHLPRVLAETQAYQAVGIDAGERQKLHFTLGPWLEKMEVEQDCPY